MLGKMCKWTTGGRLLTKSVRIKVSSFSPAVLSLSSSCTEAEGTRSVGGTRCCAALILSVTVHPGWTKTVLRRQTWSTEQHRILLQAGLCLCQVLLHTHNRHCVQFLPTPSFDLSAPPIPSASSFPLFCYLEQVNSHLSIHRGQRLEGMIWEGSKNRLGNL